MTTKWTLPGTMIQLDRSEVGQIGKVFDSMFLTGGMTLSQVCSLTGLEAYMVQNWVKRGFLTSPVGKRYSLRQLCRILNINMLRGAMPIERICQLLGYVNGDLSDESDDMIDEYEGLREVFCTPKFGRLIGDIDIDGIVSILDATEIQRIVAGISDLSTIWVRDYNLDCIVDIMDATAIQRHIAGLE